jgi:hypothetical protein
VFRHLTLGGESGYRLFGYLWFNALASIPVPNLEPCLAGDPDAIVAVRPIPAVADQRADAPRLSLDRIERVDARQLHIEFRVRALVEEFQRAARGSTPFPVNRAGKAANTLQFDLNLSGDLLLRQLRIRRGRVNRERSDLLRVRLSFEISLRRSLFGSRFVRCQLFDCSFICCLSPLRNFIGIRLFGGGLLGSSNPSLLGLIGLLGRKSSFFFLSKPGLLGGGDAGFFRRKFVALRLGQRGEEAGRVPFDEGIPYGFGA